ncbi:MAG: hypothetical protein NVS1B14_08350 [Vulcanimicrobiaceae bacterium]
MIEVMSAAAAGALSSFGPCMASRFVSVAALTSAGSARQAVLTACAFVAGTVTAYAILGLALRTIAQLAAHTMVLDTVCGVALLALAASGLFAKSSALHGCHTGSRSSLGAAFFLGGCGALALSPCCTPIVTALVVYASQGAGASYAALVLGAFALGHAAPLVLLACGNARLISALGRLGLEEAARTGSAVLSGLLGGYYLCIA